MEEKITLPHELMPMLTDDYLYGVTTIKKVLQDVYKDSFADIGAFEFRPKFNTEEHDATLPFIYRIDGVSYTFGNRSGRVIATFDGILSEGPSEDSKKLYYVRVERPEVAAVLTRDNDNFIVTVA